MPHEVHSIYIQRFKMKRKKEQTANLEPHNIYYTKRSRMIKGTYDKTLDKIKTSLIDGEIISHLICFFDI